MQVDARHVGCSSNMPRVSRDVYNDANISFINIPTS
jgi:hypothetical protein